MKAPTKHGLDRKFKPWRRGKSEKSNKRSSLKQHLRGLERLLKKVSPDDSARRQELESQIQSVKSQIDEKQSVLQEKKHAEKAHGQRFLDRQRLTRQEKQARKKEASSNGSEELLKIALDQVYVAHHPNDIKYMPLFRKGDRVTDSSRALFRRAVTRARILRELANKSIEIKLASWVSKDQYDRLPKEWSIQDEERVFGGSISRIGKASKGPSAAKSDSRFALASNHDAVLEEAAKIDAALDEVEEVGESSSSEDEDSDDDDDADPLEGGAPAPTKTNVPQPDDSSSSDDDSSDDESTSPSDRKDVVVAMKRNTNDEDDNSSSSSDSSVEQEVETPAPKSETAAEVEEVDDFLMDADQEDDNVFSMTLKQVPAMDTARGDKSKGWESQRQRPFQKRQRRR